MSTGLFVTGTDTEIGKTAVSAGLTCALQARGVRVAPVKPIAAGTEWRNGRRVNEDVQQLWQAQALGLTEAEVGPLQLDTACAPHIAARRENRPIERASVLQSVRRLESRCELVLVEGVGGFRVPLSPGWDTADLAVDLAYPVVLVVGLRLGCINHALLTAEAIRARGLTLLAWVGNAVSPQWGDLEDNLRTLQDGLGVPCWGHVPWLNPCDAASVASHLHPVWPLGAPASDTSS